MPPSSATAHEPALSHLPLRVPAAALVGTATFAFLLANGNALLNDPDTQWHVAIGRWIWAMQAVPRTDLFSHTFEGAPWIAKEWLSQLLLYAAQISGGWLGVACLAAAALAGTVALVYAWLLRWTSPNVALGAAAVLLIVAAPHALARPHLLALPILAVWMIGLVEAVRRETAPPWWLAGAVVLWANLHASFPLGLAAAALVGAESVLQALPTERRRLAARWAGFLAISVLAAFATPYGFEPIFVALHLFGTVESIGYIQEWQPLAADAAGILSLAVLGAALAILAASWRRNVMRIVLTALLGAMMIRHSRFETSFVLVALIICAGPARTRFDAFRERPMRPYGRWNARTGLAVALALVLVVGLASLQPFRPSPSKTPVAALATARAAGLVGRVYNDYDFGGFLIAQGIKTFIDGRSDQLFIGGFMKGLEDALEAADPTPFARLLDRHAVDWALVQPNSPAARHLSATIGWERIHSDDVAVVFRRKQT